MRILVACESSGVVREAFRKLGHDAWSCDLQAPDDHSQFHIRGDVFGVLVPGCWDLMIAHPPCTYLSSSGMHWTTRGLRDAALTEDALQFVRDLMDAPVPKIAIENPVGVISNRIRKPDQIIQPYDFGDDASKRTCLWLKGLPLLKPTAFVPGRPVEVGGKIVNRWGNQTDSGQNKMPPSKDRWKLRSKTYQGIACAMAEQWGEAEAGIEPATSPL